ncbi:MAG: oligosaccharide flippase family protein [Gemmatimonadota bacterium]
MSDQGTRQVDSTIADTVGRKAVMAIGVSSIGFGVGFVGAVVVARLLGAEGKGTFSLFMATVSGIMTFAGLGIDKGQMFYAARDPRKLAHFLANGVVVSLVLGGGGALIYFLLGHYADLRITSMGRFGTIAGILLVPIVSIQKFQKQYLITVHHYVLSRTSLAVQQSLPLLAVLALFPFIEVTVDALIIAVTASTLAQLVILDVFMRKVVAAPPRLSPTHFSFSFARDSLGFGMRRYLSDVTLFLTKRMDFFLVAWLLDRSALGVYSVAVALSEVVLRIPRELGVILFPVFASDSLRKGQAASFLRRMNVIALLMAAGIAVVAKPLILFMFGPEFAGSAEPFLWLLPGTIAWSTIQVTYNRVSAGGRPGLGVPIFGAAAAIDAGLNVLLDPVMGVAGAAVAATCSYLFAAIIFLRLFCRSEECGIAEALLPRMEDLRVIGQTTVGLLRRRKWGAADGVVDSEIEMEGPA